MDEAVRVTDSVGDGATRVMVLVALTLVPSVEEAVAVPLGRTITL